MTRDRICFLILLSSVSVLLHTSHWHHIVAYITMDRTCLFILLSSVSVLLHTSHCNNNVAYNTRDRICILILLSFVSPYWHHIVAFITKDRTCLFILLSSVSVSLHTSQGIAYASWYYFRPCPYCCIHHIGTIMLHTSQGIAHASWHGFRLCPYCSIHHMESRKCVAHPIKSFPTYLTLINTGKYHKSYLIKAFIRTKDQPKNTSEGS